MTRKTQQRRTLLRHNQSADVSGAALNCAAAEDSNIGTGGDNTLDGAEDTEDPDEQTAEQDNREDGQVSPDEQAIEEDSEDGSYHPLSEEEVTLGNKDFIVPKEPLEQERFKLQLIATARSLKKKQ